MVLAGLGCTTMPEFLPLLPGIATRALVEPEVARTISLVTVAGRRHSPAVGALVRLARRHPWPR
jgi:DNA-binding transcriptional LysR family regulator